MFNASGDQDSTLNIPEEILRRNWPVSHSEAADENDSAWDILNEDNSLDGLKRHWFKQNYINHSSPDKPLITYH
jgi:hypothetical protein